MTVLSESKMARDSYIVLFRNTSAAGTTGLVNTLASTGGRFLRNVGGSTIASSSEGNCKLDNSDHIGFLVGWACTALSTQLRTLRVSKGDAWRGDVGNLTIPLTCTATGTSGVTQVKIIAGPYESARFALTATNTSLTGVEIGEHYINFTALCGSSDSEGRYVQVKPFRWPDVQYAT